MEVWKEVEGFNHRYYVSSEGRVKSYQLSLKGHILVPSPDKDGYQRVLLYYSSHTRITKRIHRLVANAFLPNLANLPLVNHKDENVANNSIDNLEWCTYSYNTRYGTGRARTRAHAKGKNKNVPVVAYYKGMYIFFPTINSCVKKLAISGGDVENLINHTGKIRTISGWQIERIINISLIDPYLVPRIVYRGPVELSTDGYSWQYFKNTAEASRKLELSSSSLSKALKKGNKLVKGYLVRKPI